MVASVSLIDITSVQEAAITNVGITQTLSIVRKNFCSLFGPIVPEEGLADTSVIENTYMTYSLPAFCDDQTENLTYTLTKSDGTALYSWIIWDGITRTLQGLVPQATVDFVTLMMTGTDKDGLSTSSTFKINFESKPYLNKALTNWQIRTQQTFTY